MEDLLLTRSQKGRLALSGPWAHHAIQRNAARCIYFRDARSHLVEGDMDSAGDMTRFVFAPGAHVDHDRCVPLVALLLKGKGCDRGRLTGLDLLGRGPAGKKKRPQKNHSQKSHTTFLVLPCLHPSRDDPRRRK